ncbi:DNA repair protein RadC [plant metagenome]|uniref:DNA repair protein RadC n=1 Tax=plant metagenome TaxID=1297885 RepID=A0A484U240_9ZZZZ
MQFSLFNVSPAQSWPVGSLLVMEKTGPRLARSEDILKRAADLAHEPQIQRELIGSPQDAKQYLQLRLHRGLEHEVFALLLLDCQHRLIEYLEPFRGTLTQAAVYPREIVKIALAKNAAAVMVAHNHPSGSLEPSGADKNLTTQLQAALGLVDIRLLDHILVAGGRALSFAETGLL